MNFSTRAKTTLLGTVFSLLTTALAAQDAPTPGGVPPQEAQTICAGKNEKELCEVPRPDGMESGWCEWTPDKKYFACNPKGYQKHKTQKGDEKDLGH